MASAARSTSPDSATASRTAYSSYPLLCSPDSLASFSVDADRHTVEALPVVVLTRALCVSAGHWTVSIRNGKGHKQLFCAPRRRQTAGCYAEAYHCPSPRRGLEGFARRVSHPCPASVRVTGVRFGVVGCLARYGFLCCLRPALPTVEVRIECWDDSPDNSRDRHQAKASFSASAQSSTGS